MYCCHSVREVLLFGCPFGVWLHHTWHHTLDQHRCSHTLLQTMLLTMRHAYAVVLVRQRGDVCLRMVEQVPGSVVHGQQRGAWPWSCSCVRGCSHWYPRRLGTTISRVRRGSSFVCAASGMVVLHKEDTRPGGEAAQARATTSPSGVLWMA